MIPSKLRLSSQHTSSTSLLFLLIAIAFSVFTQHSYAQSASHPEAKSPLPENPYLKYTDPWRWDIRTQLFLSAGFRYYDIKNPVNNSSSERIESVRWYLEDLELVFPIIREGSFYWSPNEEIDASIRTDSRTELPDPKRMYTKTSGAEYSQWTSNIDEYVYQLHIIHNSHIVVSDTVFDEKKARLLPWPEKWPTTPSRFLAPVVDSVGDDVALDADETVKKLLDFWIEDNDPDSIPQLDLVKFLTGKVIEHVQVRSPPSEFASQPTKRYENAVVVAGTSWSGFVVRPADEVAREPRGTKHDLATLLTSILRSANVPARTLVCVDQTNDDTIEKVVSLVEFAMYDAERDITLWIPIDVDRLRLNGKRSTQYKQWWNYFGTHDMLNDYVPVAYYFHPPAGYIAYDLPALYGIRSSRPLPTYAVQTILIDPILSPVSVPKP